MSTIFYNSKIGTDKLATTVSDLSPEQLIEKGVIPKGAAYLVKPEMSPDMPEEEQMKYLEIAYTHFDNYEKPTEVIIDYPAIMFSLINEMRKRRNQLLGVLDLLQQRALVKRRDNLVEEIEEDKQKLRDCLNIDVTKYTCLDDFKYYFPDILAIDYKTKFEPKLNA